MKMNNEMSQIREMTSKNVITQDKMTEELTEYLNKYRNGINKGILGENRLLKIITDEFLTSEIINTTGMSGKGDIIIKRPNMTEILIETKDYTTNVKKDEVIKFIKDINNTNYHGIMMSQNSGIVGKNDFQIDINNNNILIYIHNTKYDISKVRIAINMIDLLEEKIIKNNNNNININSETLKEINIEFQQLIIKKDKLINNLKEYYKKTYDIYNEIEMSSLNKLLNNYYANNKVNIKVCNICKKYETPNLKSLARHQSSCKKKTQENKIENNSDTNSISDE
jgi:hypothetical protein